MHDACNEMNDDVIAYIASQSDDWSTVTNMISAFPRIAPYLHQMGVVSIAGTISIAEASLYLTIKQGNREYLTQRLYAIFLDTHVQVYAQSSALMIAEVCWDKRSLEPMTLINQLRSLKEESWFHDSVTLIDVRISLSRTVDRLPKMGILIHEGNGIYHRWSYGALTMDPAQSQLRRVINRHDIYRSAFFHPKAADTLYRGIVPLNIMTVAESLRHH